MHMARGGGEANIGVAGNLNRSVTPLAEAGVSQRTLSRKEVLDRRRRGVGSIRAGSSGNPSPDGTSDTPVKVLSREESTKALYGKTPDQLQTDETRQHARTVADRLAEKGVKRESAATDTEVEAAGVGQLQPINAPASQAEADARAAAAPVLAEDTSQQQAAVLEALQEEVRASAGGGSSAVAVDAGPGGGAAGDGGGSDNGDGGNGKRKPRRLGEKPPEVSVVRVVRPGERIPRRMGQPLSPAAEPPGAPGVVDIQPVVAEATPAAPETGETFQQRLSSEGTKYNALKSKYDELNQKASQPGNEYKFADELHGLSTQMGEITRGVNQMMDAEMATRGNPRPAFADDSEASIRLAVDYLQKRAGIVREARDSQSTGNAFHDVLSNMVTNNERAYQRLEQKLEAPSDAPPAIPSTEASPVAPVVGEPVAVAEPEVVAAPAPIELLEETAEAKREATIRMLQEIENPTEREEMLTGVASQRAELQQKLEAGEITVYDFDSSDAALREILDAEQVRQRRLGPEPAPSYASSEAAADVEAKITRIDKLLAGDLSVENRAVLERARQQLRPEVPAVATVDETVSSAPVDTGEPVATTTVAGPVVTPAGEPAPAVTTATPGESLPSAAETALQEKFNAEMAEVGRQMEAAYDQLDDADFRRDRGLVQGRLDRLISDEASRRENLSLTGALSPEDQLRHMDRVVTINADLRASPSNTAFERELDMQRDTVNKERKALQVQLGIPTIPVPDVTGSAAPSADAPLGEDALEQQQRAEFNQKMQSLGQKFEGATSDVDRKAYGNDLADLIGEEAARREGISATGDLTPEDTDRLINAVLVINTEQRGHAGPALGQELDQQRELFKKAQRNPAEAVDTTVSTLDASSLVPPVVLEPARSGVNVAEVADAVDKLIPPVGRQDFVDAMADRAAQLTEEAAARNPSVPEPSPVPSSDTRLDATVGVGDAPRLGEAPTAFEAQVADVRGRLAEQLQRQGSVDPSSPEAQEVKARIEELSAELREVYSIQAESVVNDKFMNDTKLGIKVGDPTNENKYRRAVSTEQLRLLSKAVVDETDPQIQNTLSTIRDEVNNGMKTLDVERRLMNFKQAMQPAEIAQTTDRLDRRAADLQSELATASTPAEVTALEQRIRDVTELRDYLHDGKIPQSLVETGDGAAEDFLIQTMAEVISTKPSIDADGLVKNDTSLTYDEVVDNARREYLALQSEPDSADKYSRLYELEKKIEVELMEQVAREVDVVRDKPLLLATGDVLADLTTHADHTLEEGKVLADMYQKEAREHPGSPLLDRVDALGAKVAAEQRNIERNKTLVQIIREPDFNIDKIREARDRLIAAQDRMGANDFATRYTSHRRQYALDDVLRFQETGALPDFTIYTAEQLQAEVQAALVEPGTTKTEPRRGFVQRARAFFARGGPRDSSRADNAGIHGPSPEDLAVLPQNTGEAPEPTDITEKRNKRLARLGAAAGLVGMVGVGGYVGTHIGGNPAEVRPAAAGQGTIPDVPLFTNVGDGTGTTVRGDGTGIEPIIVAATDGTATDSTTVAGNTTGGESAGSAATPIATPDVASGTNTENGGNQTDGATTTVESTAPASDQQEMNKLVTEHTQDLTIAEGSNVSQAMIDAGIVKDANEYNEQFYTSPDALLGSYVIAYSDLLQSNPDLPPLADTIQAFDTATDTAAKEVVEQQMRDALGKVTPGMEVSVPDSAETAKEIANKARAALKEGKWDEFNQGLADAFNENDGGSSAAQTIAPTSTERSTESAADLTPEQVRQEQVLKGMQVLADGGLIQQVQVDQARAAFDAENAKTAELHGYIDTHKKDTTEEGAEAKPKEEDDDELPIVPGGPTTRTPGEVVEG